MFHTLNHWMKCITLTLLIVAVLLGSLPALATAPFTPVPMTHAADLPSAPVSVSDERVDMDTWQNWPRQTGELTSTIIRGDGLHVVVDQQGTVQFTREDGSDYVPVQIGTQLEDGDVLQGDATAQATIVCADLSLVEVDFTTSEVRCDLGDPVLEKIRPDKPRDPDKVQVLLSPRKTALLDNTPTIRWQNVDGVTVQRVSIEGTREPWGITIEGETQITYPSDAPALQPGKSYSIAFIMDHPATVVVESSEDVGFAILSAEDAQQVLRHEEHLRGLVMPELSTLLMVAQLYQKNELYTEAIDLLEASSEVAEQASAQLLLCDLYLIVELNDLAEACYKRVLDLAGPDAIDLQASANYQLGIILAVAGQTDEARQLLWEAETLYTQHGDAEQAAEAAKERRELPSPSLTEIYYLPLIGKES